MTPESPPLYTLPLGRRPVIAHLGRAVHGLHGEAERYRLAELWCLHLYMYDARLRLDDQWLTVQPGTASLAPPGTAMEYRFLGRSEHFFVHFRLPAPTADCAQVSAVQDLGPAWDPLARGLGEAVGFWSHAPLRAEVRLWDLLWQLAQRSPAQADAGQRVVQQACALIEAQLAQPLRIPELAAAVGVSHTHLTRLFRQHVGTTVIAYLRNRRVSTAEHLLRNTTLPIKAIAHYVGIPDLHQFNKTIRQTLGTAPRTLRG